MCVRSLCSIGYTQDIRDNKSVDQKKLENKPSLSVHTYVLF